MDRALGIERCETLYEMLGRADCVSLHCPLVPETRHIINAESIQKMKCGAFLVNTGAAELVASGALLNALKSGLIRAAALDVPTEKEPSEEITPGLF